MISIFSFLFLFFVPKAEMVDYLNNITALPLDSRYPSTSWHSSSSSSSQRTNYSSYSLSWSSTPPTAKMQYVDTRISGGVVRGFVSYKGKSPAHIYKGVPMAEPPLGNLRFKKLKPRRAWNIVWNATNYSPACLSNTTRTKSPQQNLAEDCIYMNVYADAKCTKRKPRCKVLFYIHGGGFAYDSAVMFNETQIVQKYASDGVVFLVPAYRLGIFGFLDLGNDDVVPRNLGLHDIIFALQWTKKEVEAFGGDPDEITIMGGSAGGSAVDYLMISPKVPRSLFKQAIVSSGVPFFTYDANMPQSLFIMKRYNCLYNQTSKRMYSDRQKVHCLKNVSAHNLIAEQKVAEAKGLYFAGPETDTNLLPGKNLAELLPHYKAKPLLITTCSTEMTWFENDLSAECYKSENPLGYTSKAVHQACLDRYNKTFNTDEAPNISAETLHSEALIISLINSRKGAPTYRGYFHLANHTKHGDDLAFFFGLHWSPEFNSTAEKMMDIYYPKMIKRFLNTGLPDKNWKPVDTRGKNYFSINFKVENNSLVDYPRLVHGYEDSVGAKIWLQDAAYLEKMERRAEKKQYDNKQKKAKGHNTSSARHSFWLPVLSSIVLPTSPTESLLKSDNMLSQVDLQDIINGSALGLNQTTVLPQKEAFPLIYEGQSVLVGNENAALREVWSAFWLCLTVVVLLSIVIIMMLGSKMLYGYKNERGYSYNSGDGIFSESSRIFSKHDNRPRYL